MRWLRELFLRLFFRLEDEAFIDVRRVHRTRWWVWRIRDRHGKLLDSAGIGRCRSRRAAERAALRFFGGVS